MPVENELKFILKMSKNLEDKLAKAASGVYHIEQGYMHRGKSLTVRLRKQRDGKNRIKHILTVKKKTNPGRVIEIEKNISEFDYQELMPYANGWLTKVRYVIDHWDVDFFRNGSDTYFVMAEIEMPDGMIKPEKLPKFIIDNLLYMVPREDCRFSSKKLSDMEYAQALLQEVVRGSPPHSHTMGESGS